jgi:hypothetical protein
MSWVKPRLTDDPERRQIGPVLRKRVGRYEPPPLAQAFETSKTLKLSISDRSVKANTGSASPRVSSSNGPSSSISPARRVATARCVALHPAEAVEAEAQEVVVLSHDLRAGPREVERERGHVVAEVVDPEDQFLGQRLRVAPDDPADPRVDEPVLVAGRVDRAHPRETEVPDEVRVDERCNEGARGAVDVDGHVDPLRSSKASRAAQISSTGS